MPDPKLKTAMREIMSVLDKHDIAGQITLVSKTHSEFRIKIDPSWSVLSLTPVESPGQYRIGFRLRKEDFPDAARRADIGGQSLHILAQIRDLNASNFVNFDAALKEIGKVVEIEHTPYKGFEPDTSDTDS